MNSKCRGGKDVVQRCRVVGGKVVERWCRCQCRGCGSDAVQRLGCSGLGCRGGVGV